VTPKKKSVVSDLGFPDHDWLEGMWTPHDGYIAHSLATSAALTAQGPEISNEAQTVVLEATGAAPGRRKTP
jgi:hypothetical protein